MKAGLRYAALALFICFIPSTSAGVDFTTDKDEPVLVCIDPGHPSTTSSGKTFQNGLTEVDVNWKIALKLQNLLEKEYGIKTVKTRGIRDRVMPNDMRAEFANNSKAPLVIRLHCDTGKSSGFTVYYPDRQGTHDGRKGPDTRVISSSLQASRAFHAGMAKRLKGSLRDCGIKGESRTYIGSRQGALTASIFSRIPAVTVEMCFLSNKHDARFIKSPEGQRRMARALAEGVVNCLCRMGKMNSTVAGVKKVNPLADGMRSEIR